MSLGNVNAFQPLGRAFEDEDDDEDEYDLKPLTASLQPVRHRPRPGAP